MLEGCYKMCTKHQMEILIKSSLIKYNCHQKGLKYRYHDIYLLP